MRASHLSPRLVLVLRRWVFFCAVGAVLGAVLAYFISQSLTPEYRATSSVVVQAPAAIEGGSSFTQTANQAATTVAALITQRPVLDFARDQVDSPYSPEQFAARAMASVRPETSIVDINVTDRNRARAAEAANAIANRFAETSQQQNEIRLSRVADALRERIEQVRRDSGGGGDDGTNELLAQYASVLGQEAQSFDNVVVAAPATLPGTPASPRVLLNLMVGSFLGLLLGGAVAGVRQFFDQSIRNSDDVETRFGLPALGVIPMRRASTAADHDATLDLAETEVYRLLRSNLLFSAAGRSTSSVLITSVDPAEGKTTVSVNLARALAAVGQHVLLVDTDMRRPQIHSRVGLRQSPGLSETLLAISRQRDNTALDAVQALDDGLHVLTAGAHPPNPAELLSSPGVAEAFRRWSDEYDIVVFDSPPVGAVADALTLGQVADQTLVVVNSQRAWARRVGNGIQALSATGARVTGLILNQVRQRDMSGGGYGGYGYYSVAEPTSDRDLAQSDDVAVRG